MDPRLEALLGAASRPYRGAGIYPWQFARWKLRLDPVFLVLLRRGRLPDRGRLIDLGCGQGVLLALLAAARDQFRRGEWPQGWPAPPLDLELRGVERRQDRVGMARRALRDRAGIEQGDLRNVDVPPCSVVVLLDVLLYLRREDQQRLLEKAASALEPGGLLLLRDADAARGSGYQLTRWSARLSAMGHGGIWPELHCRGAGEWTRTLEGLGFSVSSEPMSAGTPFANVLLTARKKA